MQKQQWVMGLWKFANSISVEDLGAVAQEWAQSDSNYTELYIRKVSTDQNGIGFTYRLPNVTDSKTEYEEYKYKASDQLKRKFGNDLVGWDISCPVWVIK